MDFVALIFVGGYTFAGTAAGCGRWATRPRRCSRCSVQGGAPRRRNCFWTGRTAKPAWAGTEEESRFILFNDFCLVEFESLFKTWKDRGKRLFFNTTEKLRRLSMLHFDRFHFATHMRIASFRRLTKKEKQIDHWVSIGRDFRNVSKWEGRAYFLSYIFFGRLFYLFIFFWFLRHKWAVPFANAIWSARCWITNVGGVIVLVLTVVWHSSAICRGKNKMVS